MKKSITIVLAAILVVAVLVTGCAQKVSAESLTALTTKYEEIATRYEEINTEMIAQDVATNYPEVVEPWTQIQAGIVTIGETLTENASQLTDDAIAQILEQLETLATAVESYTAYLA